jgi:4-diphosphocytidyl-2-C-methyl-D-erythritol kinase
LESITVQCNAKINLYLRVLDRRDDGFHNIETVFHSISLYDSLTVRPTKGPSCVMCDDPGVPLGSTNLALRAAEMILASSVQGVEITIEKRIPVGAGLGGGSADAAGALVGVNRLYGLNHTASDLEAMAGHLGADVKFMLAGGCAIGRGRGDNLTAQPPLHGVPLLLVVPPVTVSTGWAYDSLKMGLTTEKVTLSMITSALRKGDVASLYDLLHNDFEGLIFGRFPFVGEIKKEMLRRGADGALMSGTGPVIYGIFSKAGDAERAGGMFAERGYRAVTAKLAGCGVTVPM